MREDDIQNFRRQRLQALIDLKFGGNRSATGRALGYKDGAFVRQMLAGSRPITEKTVAQIEELPGCHAWFNAPIPQKGEAAASRAGNNLSSLAVTARSEHIPALRPRSDDVAIPLLNVAASMGRGLVLPEHDEVVTSMSVNRAWLGRNASFTAFENLCLLTGHGDSMKGTYEDGDVLLVDRGVREVKLDAVYVLALNDELYVKRLQRRPDGTVLMISDNRAYEPYLIADGERNKFQVLGRVVLAWNAKRL